MLKVYIAGDRRPSYLQFAEDVERLDIYLEGTQIEKDLLRTIEQAEYIDFSSIKDRFGYKIDVMDLSTGCKAALAVVHYPNLLINMDEAGKNAVSAVLTYCKEGNIVIRLPGVRYFSPDERIKNPAIEVRFDCYWFDNLDRLSEYLADEYPYEPDMVGGVHSV